jgi:pilus assembly protein CpaF
MKTEDSVSRIADLVQAFRSQFSQHTSELNPEQLRREIAALARVRNPLAGTAEIEQYVGVAWSELFGLGAIDALLSDPTVTEIMVNGNGETWIESNGRLTLVGTAIDGSTVLRVIERILAPLGQRADRLHPMVDARLADGSRVHAVIAPIAVDGPCLTIRRFRAVPIALNEFASGRGEGVANWLAMQVENRRSIVVSGSTGSGKTTLLNALAQLIPDRERVVTIEDTAEMRLGNRHVVRLEARQPTAEGLGEVSLRDLVRTSLRMRPDRIVVGEVRGPEALDMVQAMSTGHRGSMSTVHANSAADAIRRLELMIMMAGLALSEAAIREQLAMAIDVVVHVVRGTGGRREIAEIVEVSLHEGQWHLVAVDLVGLDTVGRGFAGARRTAVSGLAIA